MARPIRRNEAESALKALENTRRRIGSYRVNNRQNLLYIIRDRTLKKQYTPLLSSFITSKITDWYLKQKCPFGHDPEVDRLDTMIKRLKEALRRKRKNNWPLTADVTEVKKEATAYAETLRSGLHRTGKDLPEYAQSNLEWFEDTIDQVITEWEGKTEDEREVMSAEEMILSNHLHNERRRKQIEDLQNQITATEIENEGLRTRIRHLRASSHNQ